VSLSGHAFVMRRGILRAGLAASEAQARTGDAFAYKWSRRDTYEGPYALAATRAWLVERYSEPNDMSWLIEAVQPPLLLDAGCGSGLAALLLFDEGLRYVRYLGADISAAVDVAAQRFAEKGVPVAFLQVDLASLPLAEESVDAVLAEGVLHYTDSPERALSALTRLLKRGGRFMFYVYRRKGPIREFADDYIRARLENMSPEAAWRTLMPLTRLGEELGKLEVMVEVPEAIDLLEIPAGRQDLRRLFLLAHV
jgi:arsenite methyltransferase